MLGFENMESSLPNGVVFGGKGEEVASRLKGAYILDFYGAYLDEQLRIARQVVNTRK